MTVFVKISFLETIAGNLSGQKPVKQRQLLPQIIGVGDLGEGTLPQFFFVIAEHPAKPAIAAQQAPFEVLHFDSDSRLLIGGAEPLLAIAQDLLGLSSLRDVAGDMDGADRTSVPVAEWGAGDQEVAAEPLLIDLNAMLAAVGEALVVRAEGQWCIEVVNTLVARQSHAPFGVDTQVLGHRAVGPQDPVLWVDNGDEVRNGVKGPLPLLLGLGEFPTLLALVDSPPPHPLRNNTDGQSAGQENDQPAQGSRVAEIDQTCSRVE